MNRILLLLLIFTFSCAERELQLPVTTTNDITEVLDVSPIYIFYDAETGEADFNRNNMISTTNWLVNIDKRLTLKQVLPHLQYLQEKRQGDGMHKNENAKNYFTCFNEDTKSLSFMEFSDVSFNTNLEKELSPQIISKSNIALIDFNSNDKIEVISLFYEHGETLYFNSDGLFDFLNELIKSGKIAIELSFNSNISFDDYINIKSKLLSIKTDSLMVSNNEVIHN